MSNKNTRTIFIVRYSSQGNIFWKSVYLAVTRWRNKEKISFSMPHRSIPDSTSSKSLIGEGWNDWPGWRTLIDRSNEGRARRFSAFSRRAKIGRPVKIDRRRQRGDLYPWPGDRDEFTDWLCAIKGIGFRVTKRMRRSASARVAKNDEKAPTGIWTRRIKGAMRGREARERTLLPTDPDEEPEMRTGYKRGLWCAILRAIFSNR